MSTGSETATPRPVEAGTGAAAAPAALDLRGVGKTFGSTVALEEANLTVQPGEFVTLLGPSGSGKTTLLRLIVGFESPTQGQILLRGNDISRLSPAERDVGMVFQNYALFPHMTVADNIGYGLKVRKWAPDQRKRRVDEMLEVLRLSGYGSRYPRQLSGGQQQRVALGRALAYDPALILMDEPLGALDRTLRLEMEEEIRRLHRDLEATVVYVTHDQQEALALSDRIVIMRGGHIMAVGTPEALYYRPDNSFVAGFFSNANLLPIDSFERVSDGEARVQCAGSTVTCSFHGELRDPAAVKLVVRRRSLGREPRPGLKLDGVVEETLLFGDEREVAVRTESAGRIVAVLDARSSGDLEVGTRLSLYAPEAEIQLVPEV